MKRIYSVLLLSLVILSSCITHKDAVNFQGENFPPSSARVFPNKRTPYKIQPNDVLAIRVKGLEQTDTDFLNLETSGGFNAFNPAAVFVNGYSVNDSGYVVLPVLGSIKVANLTINEARAVIQKSVDKQLKNSTIFLAMVSFKVSVIGEVKNPGQYYNYNNQLTLIDALAMAGDITDFGNRKKIMLMRQTDTGNEVINLNLTDPNIIVSKYYYLLPNDVIYVQPLKGKYGRQNATNITIIAAVVTAIAGTVSVILNLNR
ncbi:polysaccharide biosynthesis/export family protein [Cytophagaceae bacterium DM2B3-1]|uniref:Polysaccharide biosynthesis/export family protein n=1 Tax=Xanthocytophaga flava TaxID=3048013 RepID=A0ABT7CNS3_9BACT|nr:polysaccharide biosynthesis/export family protein [Xanthocytophaga flavus]MDJ1468280.1 polysaccharide biosynthesis/export family protein [Xanthocytophaga flavus]MDJ1494647.1 polysaccharide biosynthesis/export family protein [Xanthocytophaga flavus]